MSTFVGVVMEDCENVEIGTIVGRGMDVGLQAEDVRGLKIANLDLVTRQTGAVFRRSSDVDLGNIRVVVGLPKELVKDIAADAKQLSVDELGLKYDVQTIRSIGRTIRDIVAFFADGVTVADGFAQLLEML